MKISLILSAVSALASVASAAVFLGSDGNNTATGWITPALKADPRLRWPKNKDAPHFAKIWYCFMDEVTRRDYRYRMADAVKIWSDAIGEPGSSHALWVGEADPLPHPYCHLGRDGKVWNPEVPPNSLQVHYHRTYPFTSATTGYHSENWLRLTGREDPAQIAHELGHVFGLLHEHQRPDRDKFVEYHCNSVIDHDSYWNKARLAGKSYYDFCNDCATLQENGFNGLDYCTNCIDELVSIRSANFDIDSIMMYDSWSNGQEHKIRQRPHDTKAYPMAGIALVGITHAKTYFLIQRNMRPSQLDVEAIKKLYPL